VVTLKRMRSLVDSIFSPLMMWLDSIISRIDLLSVPLGRPLNINNYIGYLSFLGANWIQFITTAFALAFVYLITYLIVANMGVIIKFKNMVKWW
jgi:hypothetical protein